MWWLIYYSSRQKSNNLKINDNKYFQNAVTVALNYKETKWNRVSNIKPFINKYKPEGERLRKIIQHLLLIFCALKKNKYVQLIYKKLIRIAKKKITINNSKQRNRRLALSSTKKTICIIKRNNFKT